MTKNQSQPISWIVGLALVATLLAIASKNMIVDLDLFHEMSLYRQMESEGAMPTTDAFAYTPTNNPVVHHEWATGAVLYQICVNLGLGATGLVVTKYLLTFGVGLGCFWYCRKQGVEIAIFALLAPIALNVGGWMAFTNIRAQLFTLFFLVVMFLLLDADRKGRRWWIAVWLPLVVVWGNIHGGVVSGLGLIGCYGVARTIESWYETRSISGTFLKVRHLVFTGLATAGLLNVSPYGWDYVPYLIRAIRMPRELIPEWNPIWQLDTYDALIYFAISFAVAVAALCVYWGRPIRKTEQADHDSRPLWTRDLFTPMALLLTAYMAAKHYRHGSLYAVTWMCLVPPLLVGTSFSDAIEKIWNTRAKAINVFAITIAVIAIGLSIQSEFWRLRVPGQRAYANEPILVYPVGPVDYLASNNFEGNLFVPFNLGAYVSWKLYPQVKVSIDSRYEVAYPPGALERNVSCYFALEGWPAEFNECGADAILLPKNQKLAGEMMILMQLDQWKHWKVCYSDDEFLLLVRTEKASGLAFADFSGKKIQGVFP